MVDQAAQLRKMVKNKKEAQNKKKDSSKAKTIAIASGKGGVGKSNLAVNLGLALKKRGKKVLLIDADLGMANLDILLGLSQKYNLTHVFKEKCSFQEALLEGPQGIQILPGISGADDFVDINKREVNNLLKVASQMEANYDIIIFDIGAGIHSSSVNFIVGADEVFVVMTPEPTAVMDAYGLIKVSASYKSQVKVSLIVNQVESNKKAQNIIRRMKKVIKEYLSRDVSLLGLVPYDKHVKQAVQKQKPLLNLYPSCQASTEIEKMADKILSQKNLENKNGAKSFLSKVINMFNRK